MEKSSSFDLSHGERKREAKFDFGDSGSNRFDDTGLSKNVIKGTENLLLVVWMLLVNFFALISQL